MKIFVIIDRGSVIGVYSDNAKVEVEIIDLDERDNMEDADHAEQRAQEVMSEFVRV